MRGSKRSMSNRVQKVILSMIWMAWDGTNPCDTVHGGELRVLDRCFEISGVIRVAGNLIGLSARYGLTVKVNQRWPCPQPFPDPRCRYLESRR